MKYLLLPALLFIAGCSEAGLETVADNIAVQSFRLNVAAMPGDPSAGSMIDDVTVCRFGTEKLEEIIIPERTGSGNVFSMETEAMSGRIYVLANSSELGIMDSLVPGKTGLEEFLSMDAAAGEMVPSGYLMTGEMAPASMPGAPVQVRMTRSAARLDILTEDRDVRVLGVTVRGLAERGPVWPEGFQDSVPGTGTGIFRKDFSDSPLHNVRKFLLYMVPQKNAGATAEVTAEYGGALHRFAAALPETISRNTVYTLAVHGNGTGISVSLIRADWEDGSVSGSEHSSRGFVDVESSVFSDGVRLSRTRDTVFIPYYGSSSSVSILAGPRAEVSIDGKAEGVMTGIVPSETRSLEKAASVLVSSSLRMPGSVEEKIYIDISEGNVSTGRVVLLVEASPVRIDGILSFGSDGICDFGKYADGELAVITVPDDKVLTLEFADGEDPWMKVVELPSAETADDARKRGERSYRLLGGWRPNDPKADGRIQEGLVVISSDKGAEREAYTVRRRNWGLPAVKMGDTWWCRYNLRGNLKDFRDQITCADDPASPDELFAMLQTMPEDSLLAIMGDQYQAGNPEGLPLRHDGSAFYHEGMASSAQNFGLLDPSEMAPDGYSIPGYDDYSFFSASDNFNLGGIGERQFNNMAGQRLTVRIAERDANFLGHRYGTVAFYDFSYGDSHWTLFGLGHQWNTAPGSIEPMHILLATYGDSGRTWVMEGYSSTDRPGQNWIKFVANNAMKTRTIRCVKTPVEYIY